MSVRMALAKLSAAVAGGALLGGGAVHVAEPQIANGTSYKQVKHVKGEKPKYVKHIAKRVAPKPRKVKRIRRVVEETPKCCQPQMALMPMPPLLSLVELK